MSDADARTRSSRPGWKFLLSVGSAFVFAVVAVIGSGLGDAIVDWVKGDSSLLGHSESEVLVECGTPLFVPGGAAKRLLSGLDPGPTYWEDFKRDNEAVVASPGIVETSIQGNTPRTVTLTRIDFSVQRRQRPEGAVFLMPCGDSIQGRFVLADLDRDPVTVIDSTDDPQGVLGTVEQAGRNAYSQIRFPWTVSVTDALLLKLIVTTDTCSCTWSARIAWRSGEKSGIISIDNGGKGYEVVGRRGLTTYSRTSETRSGWLRTRG